MKKVFFFFCFFLIGNFCVAQKSNDLLEESETLINKLQSIKTNKDVSSEALQDFLSKVKGTKQSELLGRAYFMLAFKSSDVEKKLKYADSAIYYSKSLKGDNILPMQAYFVKGFALDQKRNYEGALANYLLAESAAVENKNVGYQYDMKFNIGFLKRILGDYEEAEILFKEYIAYEEEKKEINIRSYIYALIQLSSIYYETQNIEACAEINKKGISLAQKHKQQNLSYYFVVNEGINSYNKKDYKTAIDSIEKGSKNFDEADKTIANFYLAKSYDALNKKEKALFYFKQIDTIFIQTNDLYPSLLQTYEYLIKDSREKNDLRQQLYYTNQLLRIDSIIDKDYKHLSKTITKEYDIPKYVEQREEIINDLKKENKEINQEKKWILIVSITFCLLALGGLFYYYRLKKEYKKRYEAIINKPEVIIEEDFRTLETKNNPIAVGIDEDIVEGVLQQLKMFEEKQQFLTNQISLKDVAKLVNTNSKYLSKIINSNKGKNFTTYINDLRVDYLIDKIQHDPMYQKYTIRAIAEEGGFSSPESFFRAFQKKTGLKPSYFIKKVREDQRKKQ